MLARSNPAMAFTSLNHYLDLEWMKYAHECVRKDGALGVDGQTAQEYAANLEQNLSRLIDAIKTGSYRAPPVRRHVIPKADGGERALGIPSFEDKVAQRAIAMLLEPIYEQDFLDCSYGFRPKRSAHQARRAVWRASAERQGHWVLDVDVRKYFDSIPLPKLRELLARRVADGVVTRTIHKWLKAGVLHNGQLFYPETGTPQGGVISPLLSNIFLHYALDEWFADEVQPRVRGASTLVRYADDFVMLFTNRQDAQRVLAVLAKRLDKFGLQLHPDKTRLVDFRPVRPPKEEDEGELPTSFTFLGFVHVWGRTRTGRSMVVKQLTAKERFARAVAKIDEQCRKMRHRTLSEQHQRLCQMLKGHFAYFGISGNSRRLECLCVQAARSWRYWLARRSRERSLSWEAFRRKVLVRWSLPRPRIVHRYTNA
jgi:group II intron reverse transcriptase/maturase